MTNQHDDSNAVTVAVLLCLPNDDTSSDDIILVRLVQSAQGIEWYFISLFSFEIVPCCFFTVNHCVNCLSLYHQPGRCRSFDDY